MWKNCINKIEAGIKIIENPIYEIKPDSAPVIILSLIEVSDRHSYFINIHITKGAIKHIKNINENVPINGIRVITPSKAPKNTLKIDICLKSM